MGSANSLAGRFRNENLAKLISGPGKHVRSTAITKDREHLEPFSKSFFPVFITQDSLVKSNCILRIKQNDYCVPNCFIDKKVHLRIYSDRIELWYANSKKLEMPRLIGKAQVFFDPFACRRHMRRTLSSRFDHQGQAAWQQASLTQPKREARLKDDLPRFGKKPRRNESHSSTLNFRKKAINTFQKALDLVSFSALLALDSNLHAGSRQ